MTNSNMGVTRASTNWRKFSSHEYLNFQEKKNKHIKYCISKLINLIRKETKQQKCDNETFEKVDDFRKLEQLVRVLKRSIIMSAKFQKLQHFRIKKKFQRTMKP